MAPVAPNVWCLTQSVEDPSIRTENSYIVRDDEGILHIVDPGEDAGGNLASLVAAIEVIGGRLCDVRTVTLTHLHTDHGGLAPRVREMTGAQLILHEREQEAIALLSRQTLDERRDILGIDAWGVPSHRIDEATRLLPPMEPLQADLLVRGDMVQTLPQSPFEFIPTPGHTSGHLCAFDPRNRTLISGDHLLHRVTPAIGIGGPSDTNPLSDYLLSSNRLRAIGSVTVLPGHGAPFHDVGTRIDAIADRHSVRVGKVSSVLASHPGAKVWDVASLLPWSRPWTSFQGTYLASALLQTKILMDFIDRGDSIPARWMSVDSGATDWLDAGEPGRR